MYNSGIKRMNPRDPDRQDKEQRKPMSLICRQCGKTVDGEGIAFCPYCGAKLAAEAPAAPRNEEAEKWIRKAQGVRSYPEKKKILQQALEACPGDREIAWEMLFVGDVEKKKHARNIDFSIIKCYVLDFYRNPREFSEDQRNKMRAELFDAPQLKECLAKYDDPEKKQQEYLQRLCREYIEIFLEGSNQVMGSIFGFQLERNKDKKLAVPVAEMISRIRRDEKLLPEQREQLWQALYQGYASRTNGKTEYLDERLG